MGTEQDPSTEHNSPTLERAILDTAIYLAEKEGISVDQYLGNLIVQDSAVQGQEEAVQQPEAAEHPKLKRRVRIYPRQATPPRHL